MSVDTLTPVDTARFTDAVRHHAAGVAVVTSLDLDGPVGMTVSTFASHSVEPPTVSCDLAVTAATLAAIRAERRFVVHLLASHQQELALRFAASGTDRFAGGGWRWQDGLPVLDDVLAVFTCRLLTEVEVGDHAIVLGTVTDVATDATRTPLVHQDRAFHRIG